MEVVEVAVSAVDVPHVLAAVRRSLGDGDQVDGVRLAVLPADSCATQRPQRYISTQCTNQRW